jgi:hypothetical protein
VVKDCFIIKKMANKNINKQANIAKSLGGRGTGFI